VPDADHLLDGLDPEQREVATSLRGPVTVIAGAGTGKTRAITHRIAYGVATGLYEPHEVLAVTFTTRAAGEMRGRLADLGAPGVQARTFHSAALRQARYFWPQAIGTAFPEIIESKFGLVGAAAGRVGVRGDRALVRDLAAEVEWAKVSTIAPADYPRRAAAARRQVGDLDATTVSQILAAYEDVKGADRIDMEDILLVTASILGENPEVAAAVRRQYRWFVVDEFQDVNPLQSLLLDLWLGGREDVCVVGDPQQTIYSFAGASPSILGSFARKFEHGERHELVRNYRSTPQIVAVANAVFGRARSDGVVLQPQKPPGDPVTYVGHPDEPTEAQAVANEIALLHRRGVPYREMAVLYRINAQSEAYEEALGEHGIPYTLRGGEGFFRRAEVRQAVALLRADVQSTAADGSAEFIDDVRNILAGIGYSDTAPTGQGEVRNRWESLSAIVAMARDLVAQDPQSTMADLVADLERRAAAAHAPAADGVTLATIHSAKGLEWDAVFCVGMQEGTVPSPFAQTPAEVDEERRLFYVAVTRARHTLMVSWAAARRAGGRGTRGPTRFLDTLIPPDHESRQTARQPRQRKVARCRVCNQVLAVVDRKRGRCEDCPSTYDETLYESLREWRTREAAEIGKPAYVVFTDATLQSIAEMKPVDAAALGHVPGVGPTKLDRYAEPILELVAATR
jgi:DNA helicase-2/ATP-dependent DNA helicase PcrA